MLPEAYIQSALLNLPGKKTSTRLQVCERVTAALCFIENNLERKLTLREISRAASLSMFHLHRSFKLVTSKTPHQYYVLLKITKAQNLLDTGYTPKEVCHMLGFPDLPTFSKQFKLVTAVSPRKYRQRSA